MCGGSREPFETLVHPLGERRRERRLELQALESENLPFLGERPAPAEQRFAGARPNQ